MYEGGFLMVKRLYSKGLVFVIIVLFISVAAIPNIAIDIPEKDIIKRNPTGLDPKWKDCSV